MDNFDLRKYLAEGKLNENLQIDDLFGEYVAQWSQGNYDYDFAELKPGPIKGSLVDDFTLGPDEYDDDEYVRDYKMMRDYLLKNKSYELSRDEKEGLSQFPVQFSLEDDGETIKADIYYSPEYLAMVDADLAEGKVDEIGVGVVQDPAIYEAFLTIIGILGAGAGAAKTAEYLSNNADKVIDWVADNAPKYLDKVKDYISKKVKLTENTLNEFIEDSGIEYYLDEIKRDLEELDVKEGNDYLEDLARAILKLKR